MLLWFWGCFWKSALKPLKVVGVSMHRCANDSQSLGSQSSKTKKVGVDVEDVECVGGKRTDVE